MAHYRLLYRVPTSPPMPVGVGATVQINPDGPGRLRVYEIPDTDDAGARRRAIAFLRQAVLACTAGTGTLKTVHAACVRFEKRVAGTWQPMPNPLQSLFVPQPGTPSRPLRRVN